MSWRDHLVHERSATSTMEAVRALAETGAAEGTSVLADTQSAGRGRRGRSWHSPPGAGVYMTTLLRPAAVAADTSALALVTGLAVWRTVVALGAREARLKWPNDVLVGRRKLAGVLLEGAHAGTSRAYVLAGIGLNLAPPTALALPPELNESYAGLQEWGAEIGTSEAAHRLLDALEACYHEWVARGLETLLGAWPQADALANQVIRVMKDGRPVEGRAEGLNERGELRVLTSAGRVEVRAGEVEWVRALG